MDTSAFRKHLPPHCHPLHPCSQTSLDAKFGSPPFTQAVCSRNVQGRALKITSSMCPLTLIIKGKIRTFHYCAFLSAFIVLQATNISVVQGCSTYPIHQPSAPWRLPHLQNPKLALHLPYHTQAPGDSQTHLFVAFQILEKLFRFEEKGIVRIRC